MIAVEIIGLLTLAVVLGLACLIFMKSGAEWMMVPWIISGAISYFGALTYLSIGRLILRAHDRSEFEKYFSPFIYGSVFTSGFVAIVVLAVFLNKYA
jgi:hypothetical protein